MLKNNLCAVLVPVARYIEPECEESLRELERRGYHVHRLFGMSAVDQARNILIAQALEGDYQEFVWIDSDVAFDPADVDRLRRHNKPVVVGLYSMKGEGGVAAEYLGDAPDFGPKAGLYEIRYAGLGFCFTKREVYEKMALANCSLNGRRVRPFFLPMLVEDGGEMRYLPEDFAFFYRVGSHGFKVLADTSIHLRHFGRMGYEVQTFRPAENFRITSRWGGRDSKPGVVFVLHTHNHEGVIRRCLQSIEAAMSGYPKWAVSVTDTGTDGTVTALKEWSDKTKASGFKVKSMPEASFATAMNDALGNFPDYPAIALMDPASQLMPARLKMLSWMVENDSLFAWGSHLDGGRKVKPDESYRTPAMSSTLIHSSICKPFDDSLAGDTWLDLADRISEVTPPGLYHGGLTSIEFAKPPRKIQVSGDADTDAICAFYSTAERRPKIPVGQRFVGHDLVNTPAGLGDATILTALPSSFRANHRSNRIWAPFPGFDEMAAVIPDYLEAAQDSKRVAADVLQNHYDMGNGHIIQRLHRAMGMTAPVLPAGHLQVPGDKVKGRVALHFCPGRHANWQRKNIHERARQIYPETAAALQEFMGIHTEMEFVEVGEAPMGLVQGALDNTGLPLIGTMKVLKTCEYFIGIMSGPMHLATALGCKGIIIINFPDPTKIFLPTLVDIDQVESEWFYSQNVHLHQEGEGQQVKQFSLNNLERAFAGELYPYWTHRYLNLINECL